VGTHAGCYAFEMGRADRRMRASAGVHVNWRLERSDGECGARLYAVQWSLISPSIDLSDTVVVIVQVRT